MKILITAGPVYGRLDDNKLISNRSRGIWAVGFAQFLSEIGYEVTLLIPDTGFQIQEGSFNIIRHSGYQDYAAKCYEAAKTHDGAVMAAAVVNWIPANPITGKMPTAGYKPGDIIQVPFILAERVIEKMRVINPALTLIGCKMLSGSSYEELIEAAHHVTLDSKAHMVVANDLKNGLKTKYLVYPDRCVQKFDADWEAFYHAMLNVLEDTHWHTEIVSCPLAEDSPALVQARVDFDMVVNQYRSRFLSRDGKTVFGAILIPIAGGAAGYLVSPRTKDPNFTSKDAVWVAPVEEQLFSKKLIRASGKPTMNVCLLLRVSSANRYQPVFHLHEKLEKVSIQGYAPPGTDRDNLRIIPDRMFNIEGHGFIFCGEDINHELPLHYSPI